MDVLVIGLFGLLLGSFLNVCIHRLPLGISVVRPASRCPHCKRPVRAIENIPVISYVFLRGRCRGCGAPISPRYPIIELVVAAGFILCYHLYGASAAFLEFAFFTTSMILLVVTDFDTQQLPDEVTLSGLVVALVFAWWLPHPGAEGMSPGFDTLKSAIYGAVFGAGVLWMVGEGYMRLRGRPGMGLGDVKMMGMVGAFLGLPLTFLTILLASLVGSIVGLLIAAMVVIRRLLRWRARHRPWREAWGRAQASTGAFFSRFAIPFGVFLGSMSIVSWLWGTRLLHWYLSQFWR